MLNTQDAKHRTQVESPTPSIIQRLGFGEPHDVSGHLSIAELFPKSKRRCGIYLLGLANNLWYIGQASDVVRRFGQHRVKHNDLREIYFLPVRRSALDFEEQQLIRNAEKLGLPLTNKVFVSSVAGETDLDVLFPVSDQERWLLSPVDFRVTDERLRVEPSAIQRARYRSAFSTLSRRLDAAVIADITASYVRGAMPAPRVTEYSFWSVSCMPSTNAAYWPRLVCFNINHMETFVLGHDKKSSSAVWGLINVSRTRLNEAFENEAGLRQASRASNARNEITRRAASISYN